MTPQHTYYIDRQSTSSAALPFLHFLRQILPALLIMLLYGFSASAFTVVIDAGHGGRDHGAIGSFTNEKTINLAVARRVSEMLRQDLKDCRVVMTRDNDRFVPLQSRADAANAAKGDIFVSIHTNSVALDSPGRSTVNGASVYTLGLEKSEANMEIAKRENSVIMLEADYTKTYKGFDPNSTESYIMFELDHSVNLGNSIKLADDVQRELKSTAGRRDNGVRQAPFYVLVKTAMPAILVELDFICNPTQEKFMSSHSGTEKLARAITNGIIKYYNEQNNTVAATVPSPTVDRPAKNDRPAPTKTDAPAPRPTTAKESRELPAAKTGNGETVYKVQFMTSGSKVLDYSDSRFKGLTGVDHYKDSDGMVKYTTGATTVYSEAKKTLARVKKNFPQAFIIKTVNGKRVR